MTRLYPVIALLALCTIASANSPRLTVQGEARLEVPADQFSLTIGATATASTVKAARTEVDATMTKLIAMVSTAGLKRDEEWHTGRYDISPQWKPRPRGQQSDSWTSATRYDPRSPSQLNRWHWLACSWPKQPRLVPMKSVP